MCLGYTNLCKSRARSLEKYIEPYTHETCIILKVWQGAEAQLQAQYKTPSRL